MIFKIDDVINGKKGNIGSLTSFIRKREYLLKELTDRFDYVHSYTIPEMCRCVVYNDYSKRLCSCGSFLKWQDFANGWRATCGNKKCVFELRELLCLEKYGVSNPMQNKEVRDKGIETNIKKYGVSNPMQNKDIKKKSIDTFNAKSDEEKQAIKDKILNTHYSKSDEEKQAIIDKRANTFNSKSDEEKREIYDKRFKTNVERYGFGYTFHVPFIQEKIKSINNERYGSDFAVNSPIVRAKIGDSNKETNVERLKLKMVDCGWEYVSHIINTNNNIIYTVKKDDKIINISIGNLKYKLENNIDLEPLKGISRIELALKNFIESIYSSDVDKFRLGRLEIDIYLKELNIGFEMNGLYWHSENYKDKYFHLNKTNSCKENGIKLIHIWEDDWNFKNEIVKSRIRNILQKNENKIYARKCSIKEVKSSDARKFLDDNHLQGFVSSNLYIGLYHNNILVSIMTFGKRRNFMNSVDDGVDWELYRFCNIINTSVVGGADKLFKYFIQNYEYKGILSYSDKCWNDAVLYTKLGFVGSGDSDVGYHWVNDERRHYRYKFAKYKLVEQGYDKDKTGDEIMHERGFYKIFDCGNQRWIYKK